MSRDIGFWDRCFFTLAAVIPLARKPFLPLPADHADEVHVGGSV
jgi:hypothetical protein